MRRPYLQSARRNFVHRAVKRTRLGIPSCGRHFVLGEFTEVQNHNAWLFSHVSPEHSSIRTVKWRLFCMAETLLLRNPTLHFKYSQTDYPTGENIPMFKTYDGWEPKFSIKTGSRDRYCNDGIAKYRF